jgi:phosphate transport system substrate-binding protein
MSVNKRVFMLNAIKMRRLSDAVLMIGFLLGVSIMTVPSAMAAPQSSTLVETIKAVRESLGDDNTQTKSTKPPPAEAAPNSSEPKIILKLHGAATLGTDYVPRLAKYLLEKRGHRVVERKPIAEEVFQMVGQGTPTGEREAIEISHYGSATAFAESQTFKKVGLEKKFADIGMSARRVNAAEIAKLKKAGYDITSPLSEHVVALDGIAIYVNPSNPIVGLTLDEVRRIYLHEVSDWSEVNGVDADGKPIHGKAGAIKPYCPHCRQGDGTYDFLKQNLFNNTDLDLASSYVKTVATYPDMQAALAADPNGIGYGSISFWSASSNSSRPLRLSRGSDAAFIDPNEFAIKTGEYPLTRNLYLYTAEKKSPLVGQFIALALSPIGQTMVVESHLVSATSAGEQTASQASAGKQQLLSNPKVPDAYKTLIRDSDRTETPYNLRFEAGSGQLDNKSLIDLGRLVQTLKESRNQNVSVVLVGFSDSRGEADTNLKLSIARAQYVTDVLKTQGITQVEIAGFGEEPTLLLNPVENSPKALKDNRRVEVWLKHPAQAVESNI